MASDGSGIIRTASGRQTYAPDGYAANDSSPQDDSTFTRNTSKTSDSSETIAAPVSSSDDFINEEGQERAESPPRDLKRTNTVDRTAYEPVIPGDREALTRLATNASRVKSQQSRQNSYAGNNDLERRGTLDGLEDDDPKLQPGSASFDLHAWLRYTMKQLDSDDIKTKRAGILFKSLNISGSGSALQLQKNVGSFFLAPLRANEYLNFGSKPRKQILRNFDGLLKSGEMLVVLGRPGSGCSTLLKTLTGEMHGLAQSEDSHISYNGISQKQMLKEFKGEVVYNQEVDKHFPFLTVKQTLRHACAMRTPSNRPNGMSRKEFIDHIVHVVMNIYGLQATENTFVGDDFVRGVSGGERKRVSIAELATAGSPLAAWDNSTRGLDSASALSFTKSLRQSANIGGSAHAVAIYQASQSIYDQFDKAIVLYEGREIFFGPTDRAQGFFEDMGWFCPQRQTTGDFLTSVTNPSERQTREGFEGKVPRTPDEFEQYWKNSPEYENLMQEIANHEEEFPVGNAGQIDSFQASKKDQQANHTRAKSSYVVSVPMQIKLNTSRAYQRLWNDKASTLTTVVSQIVMALIVGSIYYGTPSSTASFFSLGAVLFFAVLFNALIAISEINALYAQRPIVEKHKSYAFYHPATEAIAGVVADIPVKFLIAVCFNLILYWLAGLRAAPGQFFLYFLVVFISMFIMSAVFRTMAAVTKTISQAMALAGVLVLALVVYTGFVVPISYMRPWFGWIRWLNPLFYGFEILISNEFHGRRYECANFVPAYPDLTGTQFVCSVAGAVAGERTVSGDAFILNQYNYAYSNVWSRDFPILVGFLIAFMGFYFMAVEFNSSTTSSAEVLVFRRGHVPAYLQDLDKKQANDEEAGGSNEGANAEKEGEGEQDVNAIPPQTDIFTWRNVTYEIPVKDGNRTLLDNISGWVKPGTLTALMGTSGAGKTTLLDALAQRTSMGVLTGDMFVNGKPLDSSFQRKTGYVQQQDLHLETATVRESLRFSAVLRQPPTASKQEKYDYVEEVIKMLGMEDFAEAIVGVPGEGLNVEQRKLLTIGVELAAKPKLLLFLDEPTSGLDSQSSWAICAFLRKLADHGQAVLCTIHQPSAILFQTFDRLLFLRAGGQTVYFGDIGENSRTLLDYFESNGARHCDDKENPAEYMLEVAADKEHDWFETWQNSKEATNVQTELDNIHREKENVENTDEDPTAHQEFAMPFTTQLREVTVRVFQQYWRLPSYILAKFGLSLASGLFIGFSFYDADNSTQGMQGVLFSIFMVSTIFSSLVQQIMPLFVTQRSLYESRERPSKAYSWQSFLIANVVVELPYQLIAGVIVFGSFYYPVVGIQSPERQGLVLLYSTIFFVYASTFAQLLIAGLPDAQTAGGIATTFFSLLLLFNGVMQPPDDLPGFWIFMYRVSSFTYWVGGIAAAMLHDRPVVCSETEINIFDPPPSQTCGEYMAAYLTQAPGTLQNPGATADCRYCALSNGDQFLEQSRISWGDRYFNYGILYAYLIFNIAGAVALYWFLRVRPTKQKKSSGAGGKKIMDVVKGLFSNKPPAKAQKEGEQKTADGNPGQQEEKENPRAF